MENLLSIKNSHTSLDQSFYVRDIGKNIWNRDKTLRGVIKRISRRYCAACQRTRTCYIVRWEDGSLTKPCPKGVMQAEDSEDLIII